MELLITIIALIVLGYLSIKLAGCLVGIVRIALTVWIFWLLYTYVVEPWLSTL